MDEMLLVVASVFLGFWIGLHVQRDPKTRDDDNDPFDYYR